MIAHKLLMCGGHSGLVYAIAGVADPPNGDTHMAVFKRAGGGWTQVFRGTQPANLVFGPTGARSAARINSTLVVLGTVSPATEPPRSEFTRHAAISISQDAGLTWAVYWVPVVDLRPDPSPVFYPPVPRQIFAGGRRFVLAFECGVGSSFGGFGAGDESTDFNSSPSWVSYSDDGVTWSSGSQPVALTGVFTGLAGGPVTVRASFSGGLTCGAYGAGRFIAGANGFFRFNPHLTSQDPVGDSVRSAAERIVASSEGASFSTALTASEGSDYIFGANQIAYQKGRGFFALAYPIGIAATVWVFTSPDGNAWARQADIAVITNVSAAATRRYALFSALNGSGGTDFYRSSDGGANWSHVSTIAGSGTLLRLFATDDRFFAFGVGGTVKSGVDGVTWKDETVPLGGLGGTILSLC